MGRGASQKIEPVQSQLRRDGINTVGQGREGIREREKEGLEKLTNSYHQI